jgi:hypothetical protein
MVTADYTQKASPRVRGGNAERILLSEFGHFGFVLGEPFLDGLGLLAALAEGLAEEVVLDFGYGTNESSDEGVLTHADENVSENVGVGGNTADLGTGVIDRKRNWLGRGTGIHEWRRKARRRRSRKKHRLH